MDRQVDYGQSAPIASGANSAPLGPTLGEISAQIERRLRCYGLSAMTLDGRVSEGRANPH